VTDKERERERERGVQTDRQRKRESDREKDREIERKRKSDIERDREGKCVFERNISRALKIPKTCSLSFVRKAGRIFFTFLQYYSNGRKKEGETKQNTVLCFS